MKRYNINKIVFIFSVAFLLLHKNAFAQSFEQTLNTHLDAIKSADLARLEPTVADNIIHISPTGEMNKSKTKFMALHEDWFKRTNWQWQGTILESHNDKSTGYVLIEYTYSEKDSSGNPAFSIKSYLTLIFSKTKNGWQLVYDQNTAIPG